MESFASISGHTGMAFQFSTSFWISEIVADVQFRLQAFPAKQALMRY